MASPTLEFLWKCPLRCQIPQYERAITPEGEVGSYVIHVTTIKGTKWQISKTYDDFLRLRAGLPNAVCMKFKHAFPMPRPYTKAYMLSNEFLEYRRVRLESWLCELLLVDSSLTSIPVMTQIKPFLELDEHHFFDVETVVDSSAPGGSVHGTFRKRSKHLQNWRIRNYIVWDHGNLSEYDQKTHAVANNLDVKRVFMRRGDVVRSTRREI